jgi:hypothetical protein
MEMPSMASSELIQSWARTDAFLREARAALPAGIAAAFSAELMQFEELLEHNELGLAFDCLQMVLEEADYTSPALTRPLHQAAENMGLR